MSKVIDVNCAPVSSVSLPWWEPETALPVDIYSVEHPKEGEKDHTMGKTHVSKGSQYNQNPSEWLHGSLFTGLHNPSFALSKNDLVSL